MKFGIGLSGLGARHYPEVAAVAEANGFDSLWIPEHLIFPAEMPARYLYTPDGYPPMPPDTPAFDPFVVLAAAVPAGPEAGFRVACATGAATAVAGALAFGALQRRG